MKKAIVGLLFLALGALANDSQTSLTGLQKEYKLTDAQVSELKNSGLPNSQLAMVAGLYSKLPQGSTVTMSDILKMRGDHMGWGEIAKKLGLPPKDIGQAVAAEHRQNNKNKHDDERADDRTSRHEDRENDRKDRDERHNHGKGG
jgi:hypothetical protein